MELIHPDISTEDITRLYEGPRETDPFDGGVTAPLAGNDLASKAAFYTLEDNDIRFLQKSVDKKAIDYINKSEASGMITPEGAEYLRMYYQDSMSSYAQFYYAMLKVLGAPQSCRRNDLEPGEVDTKNYSETYITPNNSMILSYPNQDNDPDLAESNMYFTLPGMKDVVRAVAKISRGGKYEMAYQKELANLGYKYKKGGAAYQRAAATLTPVHLRLKDVLRGTISVPTYDSIEKVIEMITKTSGFEVAETKDKFQANRSAKDRALYENKKNYRDKKICFKKDNIFFEIQFKVQLLEKADNLSHSLYEKLREKIDEQNRADKNDIELCNRLEREKIWMEWDIQNINRKGIDDYNLFVLDIALKKDTRLKKDQIRRLRKEYDVCTDKKERLKLRREIYRVNQSVNAAPVRDEAQTFIKNNLIVRPFKAIDQQREFVSARPELQSFAMLNYFLVSPRYHGTIPGKLSDGYRDKYYQAQTARIRNEQETLQKEYLIYQQSRGNRGIVVSQKNYYRS